MLPEEFFPNIKNHVQKWNGCKRCLIGDLATRTVMYRGEIPCDVLLIGEAPGFDEDDQGKPFVGKSGELLDFLIEKSYLNRLKLCISNLVACRPCNYKNAPNREPSVEEVENCQDRLIEFVKIAKPKVLVNVGKVSARLFPFRKFPNLVSKQILHPSHLLHRNQTTIHDDLVISTLQTLNDAYELANA